MKKYVLILSRNFPATHGKAGQCTGFIEQFGKTKLHTIRSNFALWAKRADAINKGDAILSVRYWSGKPYKSQQIEFCQLTKVHVQQLQNPTDLQTARIDNHCFSWHTVAANDGLSYVDFCDWFKIRQDKPMAIIQFTDFQY